MSNVEPVQALNLDVNQQQTFIRFYKNLPEKAASTIRFFNHNDFYTVHGDDTNVAADIVSSSVVKYMGLEPKLSYVVLSKNNFENFVRDLLLIKQYRVEVYIKKTPGRVSEWIVEYKGSPGDLTQFESLLFESGNTNIVNSSVMAVNVVKNKVLAVGYANVTDYTFCVTMFSDNEFYTELEALIAQTNPKECVIPSGDSPELTMLKTILTRNGVLVVKLKRSDFNIDDIEQDLNRLLYFQEGQQRNSKALITDANLDDALASLQAIIKFLNLTNDERNFDQFRISRLDVHRYVRLDGAALSALHLFPKHVTRGASSYHSVFEVFDCCVTAQGRRLMEQWFRQPLRDFNVISERLDIVDALVNDTELRVTLRTACLVRVPDLLFLAKKLSSSKATLQDCYKVYQIVSNIPFLVNELQNTSDSYVKSELLQPIVEFLSDLNNYQLMIEATLDLDLVDRGEFLIKSSFDDRLKGFYKKKVRIEESMQQALQSAADTLGVDAGKVIKLESADHLGYYYRVTLKDERMLRENKEFQIIGALKGGVKFTDANLKSLNEDYLEICRSYEEQQKAIVSEMLKIAAGYIDTIRNINLCIAKVDVIAAFAHTATSAPGVFVKPVLHSEGSGVLRLVKARHVCVEKQDSVSYIPNSIDLKQGETILNIITGPNMGGKSTYMRSVALCVFLAHIGSFVPCEEAEISMVDCILTRVGSSDCELKGLSTFMMEMVETCGIIRSATSNSLVVIDELGRGTSTYDGCSIAWAIAEHLVKETKCFSLFATHFHEITNLATIYPEVQNLHVSAVATDDTITPLYQVTEGVCDKSYGIHCARMVKFPEDVIQLAEEHQKKLEFAEGMKYINDFEFSLKRSAIEEGDAFIADTLKKVKDMDTDNMDDDDIVKAVENLKSDLLSGGNLFIKGLIESSIQ